MTSWGNNEQSLRISSLRTVKFTELSDKLSIQSILRPLDNKFALEKITNYLWPDAVTCGLPSGYWPYSTDCLTVPDWCFECHLHPDMSLFWWYTAVWSQLICKQKGCDVNWSKIFLSNKNGCEPLSYRFQASLYREPNRGLCTAIYHQTVYRFTPSWILCYMADRKTLCNNTFHSWILLVGHTRYCPRT